MINDDPRFKIIIFIYQDIYFIKDNERYTRKEFIDNVKNRYKDTRYGFLFPYMESEFDFWENKLGEYIENKEIIKAQYIMYYIIKKYEHYRNYTLDEIINKINWENIKNTKNLEKIESLI